MLPRHGVEAYQGNTRTQSSQLAEPLWTDSGVKSGINLREVSPLKKKKKRGRGIGKPFPKILAARKKLPPLFAFLS